MFNIATGQYPCTHVVPPQVKSVVGEGMLSLPAGIAGGTGGFSGSVSLDVLKACWWGTQKWLVCWLKLVLSGWQHHDHALCLSHGLHLRANGPGVPLHRRHRLFAPHVTYIYISIYHYISSFIFVYLQVP